MRSDRWTTKREFEKVLKAGAAGPVLFYDDGKAFTYDGEGHVMILGVSGSGKSRRGTIPMTMTFIKNKESAVIADPKGEIYANTKDLIPDVYDVHVIDFRNLYEDNAEGWNPLYAPYILWKDGTPENRHIAEQMIEGLAHTMYPEAKYGDPFWINEARNVFLAAVYSLFEYGSENQINLASVYYFISKGEEKFAGTTFLKNFVDMHENNENVTMQLQSYVTTANDTRGGIRSTFLDGVSIASKSISIRNFLSHDELHINELKGDKPTLIYVIVPDETPIYDDLTGILVSQLMNHFVRIAEQKYSGKLPIRVNVLIEELGNIGRAITNLPHLMTAGRSRGIRVEYVVQSISQLVDIYGESNATTILSNSDVRVAFRVNHWDTLTELSRLCGEREVHCDGHVSREPLITQSQLAAMEIGQALVLVSGRIKFITWLPDFSEMSISQYTVKNKAMIKKGGQSIVSYFDIQEHVKERKFAELEGIPHSKGDAITKTTQFAALPHKMDGIDLDSVIKKIDQKIAVLEREEKKERTKQFPEKIVEIVSVRDEKKTATILEKLCGLREDDAVRAIRDVKKGVFIVQKLKCAKAEKLVEQLSKIGTVAGIKEDVGEPFQ